MLHLFFITFFLTFVTIGGESCPYFRGRSTDNIAVDPSKCRMETYATSRVINTCLDECDKESQCTGVAVENNQQSSFCCFFTENPIGVKSGPNVLIYKPGVQTGCLFGFDPGTNCSGCLSSQRYNLHFTLLNDGSSHSTVLDILLTGDLCTQIGGLVQNAVIITSGKLDRGNKTWTFEAENRTKFRATLLNGNMVNGTGKQPTMGDFTFTAIAVE